MEPVVVFIVAIIISILVAFTTETNKEKEYVYESVVKSNNENENKTDCEPDTTNTEESDFRTDWRTNLKNINMETPKGTKDLLLETLTKIGCQYELGEGEDTDRIYFAFQGENFVAIANNEEKYVIIWDPCWWQVELYDIDEFSRLRKAINTSNLNCSVTTIFTIDEAAKHVDVHCKTTTVFIPEIPENEDYLRVILGGFFEAHRYVSNEIAKQRVAEEV
jgi:hypothetical protein